MDATSDGSTPGSFIAGLVFGRHGAIRARTPFGNAEIRGLARQHQEPFPALVGNQQLQGLGDQFGSVLLASARRRLLEQGVIDGNGRSHDINDAPNDDAVKVFPNPAKDRPGESSFFGKQGAD